MFAGESTVSIGPFNPGQSPGNQSFFPFQRRCFGATLHWDAGKDENHQVAARVTTKGVKD